MKFATIAVIAIAATTAEAANSCGSVTVTSFTDEKCSKATVPAKVNTDLSTSKLVDACTKVGTTAVWMKITCDTTGKTVELFSDKACKTSTKK